MTDPKLHNLLKTYRKRSGLSQTELGFLLGHKTAAEISRYEQRVRTPHLHTALAYSLILGVLAETLFFGVQRESSLEAIERMKALLALFKEKPGRSGRAQLPNRKLAWLSERLRQIENNI